MFVRVELRAEEFADGEIAPYFFAYAILESVMWIFAFGEANPWDIAASVASVVITVFGILYLKKKNGDTFGNGFLNKRFALGWVIGVRIILIVIPSAVALFAVATIIGGEGAVDPAGALFVIMVEVLFYWWLGQLFLESHPREVCSGGSGSLTRE